MKKNVLLDDLPLNSIVTAGASVLAFGFLILLAYLTGCKADCNFETLGNLGSYVSGIAALVGVFFALWTLKLQYESLKKIQKQNHIDRLNSQYREFVDSVFCILGFIETGNEKTITGGAAIIKLSEMVRKNQMEIKQAETQLGISNLHTLVAGLNRFLKWMLESDEQFSFYAMFKMRFINLILALETLIPEYIEKMSKDMLEREFIKNLEMLAYYKQLLELKNLNGEADRREIELNES